MPKQRIMLDVEYTYYDDNGEPKDPPSEWPWESMADHYGQCQEDGSRYYTRRVKVTPMGRETDLAGEEQIRKNWHEGNCTPDVCLAREENCPMKAEEPTEEEDLSSSL